MQEQTSVKRGLGCVVLQWKDYFDKPLDVFAIISFSTLCFPFFFVVVVGSPLIKLMGLCECVTLIYARPMKIGALQL